MNEQSFDVEQTKLALKQAYLKTLREELQKSAESPETIARLNECAPFLADAHAHNMIEPIKAAYGRHLNSMKQARAAKWCMILCLLLAAVLMEWYGLILPLGWVFELVGFTLTFVAVLVLSAIFNRSR